MYHLTKIPKPRAFKEFHLKRMAHIGYTVITKKFDDETFMVIECNMNGHWYGIGFGKNGTCQWWPSLWHNVTTKDEVDNKRMNYEYEFFNSFDDLRTMHKDLVKSRVLTQAPNDFTGGEYAFNEDLPQWKELLRYGMSLEKVLSLSFISHSDEEIKAYIAS